MIKRVLLMAFTAVLMIFLVGCVTTTNMAPVNKKLAHDKRIDLGMKYLDIDKRDNARRQFSLALDFMPNSALAHHGIALVHIGNGETEPAAKAFEKALGYSAKENRTTIEVSYAKYLMSQGDIEKACPYFEKATTDYDYQGRVDALYLSGKCALRRGDKARVKGAYEHVINLNPNYVPVLIDLADIYFKDEEYSKCRKLLDTYEKLAKPTARSLWLGIRIERIFGNKNRESSLALALKSRHPYSNEYLEYKRLLDIK